MDKMSGIYKIQSRVKPERVYIGSAVDIEKRWRSHKSHLYRRRHHSAKLQNHYNKYGLDDLVFSIITSCPTDDLISLEQFFIDSCNPYFNICPTAGSPLGKVLSEKTKLKIAEANIGLKHPHTQETKDKIKQTMRAKYPDGPKERPRKAPKGTPKGHHIPHSDETKRKISNARKGQKASDETKMRMSKAKTGFRHSSESKRKMSESKRNMSEETRANMRAGWVKRRRKKREAQSNVSLQ